MQFDAFDSNRLHESEIRGQGNQRFFPSLSPRRFAALSLFGEKNFKENLWDQGMTLWTKRLLTSRSWNIGGEVYSYQPGGMLH